MAGIGGVETSIIRGIPASLKPRVDTWENEGIDGVGAQTLGLGDSEFELTAILYCESNDDANQFIADCEALVPSESNDVGLVTVVDDWGDEYENILVKRVDKTNAKRPLTWKGISAAVRVELKLQMVSTVSL